MISEQEDPFGGVPNWLLFGLGKQTKEQRISFYIFSSEEKGCLINILALSGSEDDT